MVVVEYTLQKP